MKKVITAIFLISIRIAAFGQSELLWDSVRIESEGFVMQYTLLKDLDNDGIRDSAYLSVEDSTIVCRLSTQNFTKMASKPIEILNFQSGVGDINNGFQFFNHWMRAGCENQFRYNPQTKKMQLIGMNRYEFGNAMNDGSGESSVNLLTGNYTGDWNYYDSEKDTLIKIPTIYANLNFGVINLEDFSQDTYFDYSEKCAALYNSFRQLDSEQAPAFFRDENIQPFDMEHLDTINLQFVPISEDTFLKFKEKQSHQPGSKYNFGPPANPSFSLATQNEYYKFIGDSFGEEYRYVGYVPEISSYIISACKWVCTGCLLDNETDEKMQLPDSFDSGVLGLEISASKKQMLMFSSYYGDDYAKVSSHRAEIIFMQIGEGKGFHKLVKPEICIITAFSIEDIIWIDNNSIALKVYDKYEEVWNDSHTHTYHEPVYQYLKAEIKTDK